ncbi:MAG TPA: Asp-tRNA(Asn)/Glu-tRNA(Gln) amidotransferase subunit GatA [Elusimicrobiales bacterium]|nr:Asp-tRNA(Asn)/Glu-tRNA(Gln) amidotransferase subunit GatA [Elusimicrobiales bacterium]
MTSEINKIVSDVNGGKITAVELTKRTIENIKKTDGNINAFLEVFERSAALRAKEIDEKRSKGKPLGRLAGVCVAIKDNILYKDYTASCGSKMLENYKAVYNSTVVEKLLAEDAIIIGRTNMDEFAMGSSCENSAYGPTKNPADLTRVPGGSSGGSAAAVAGGMVPLAFGSDTSGSVRQPAAFCGSVGLRPTYGCVSRYGLVAFASSLDQIGPLTNSVADCALAASVISGFDPKDQTSSDKGGGNYLEKAKKINIKNLTIGIAKEYFSDDLDGEIAGIIKSAADSLKKQGAKIIDISLPHTKYAVPAYYIIAPSEASSNLARFDGIRYGYSAVKGNKDLLLKEVYEKSRNAGFGAEVKRRIMLGTYSLSSGYYDAYYLKAQKVRALIKKDFENAFKKVDLILTPSTPTPAFKLGEKTDDPISMYLSDVFSCPSALAGVCAINVPCGKTKNGLPVGLQLMANYFEEEKLFAGGFAIEKTDAKGTLNA